MNKLSTLLISILFLVGCSTNRLEVEVPKTHPVLPSPVHKVELKPRALSVNGNNYIAMTLHETKTLLVYMEDLFRYTKNLKGLVCYYRSELDEEFCFEHRIEEDGN